MLARRLAAAPLVIALVLTACGGDDTADEPATSEPAASEPATEEPAESAEGATITISNFSFSGVTEVAAGTTVVVTNTDGSPHTWSALDGSFDSGALNEGDSFEFTFTEPGTFDYQCNFHPSMTGTIVVTG